VSSTYRFLGEGGWGGRGLRLLADACQAEFRIFYRTEQNILDKIFKKSEMYIPINVQCTLYYIYFKSNFIYFCFYFSSRLWRRVGPMATLYGMSVTNIISQHKVQVQEGEGQHLIE
jgi:hypothetical protein